MTFRYSTTLRLKNGCRRAKRLSIVKRGTDSCIRVRVIKVRIEQIAVTWESENVTFVTSTITNIGQLVKSGQAMDPPGYI